MDTSPPPNAPLAATVHRVLRCATIVRSSRLYRFLRPFQLSILLFRCLRRAVVASSMLATLADGRAFYASAYGEAGVAGD